MTILNTNLSAIAAQNSLRTSGLNQTTAMERLSSGIRINSAKDDAAGLAISTRMTANIRGLNAAIRNANDGISLTQTAEGSLSSIGDNLQRIRELAVQSANTGNNESDRAALNTEARQLVSEIDRIANNSQFNGIKLLDGSFQNQSLQVGAGNEMNDRISISIGSAKVSALGIGSNSSYARTLDPGTVVQSSQLAAGALSINGAQIGASQTDGVSYNNSNGSAIAKAAAINAASGLTGVTASVSATKRDGVAASVFTATAANDVKINGVDIGIIPASVATITGSQTQTEADAVARATQVAAAINAKASQTGVVAIAETVSAGSGDTETIAGRVRLSAADGRNITVTSTGNGYLKTGLGTAGIANAAASDQETTAKITLSTNGDRGIVIGGTAGAASTGQTVGFYTSILSSSGGVDLSTATGSQAALSVLDKAINLVTDTRASMGAYQNRLTASVANLETTSMNLQASRSRILDTDYAKETTNLAKSQIIQQAATAMLAQANQSAQSVLALLK
jgi:flagellin